MSSQVITEADHGKTVDLKKGDALTVELPENPTTGYRWSLDEHNPAALEAAASPAFEPSAPAVGAGGGRTFHFLAKQAGEYPLGINLRRSWEKQAAPGKTFAVNVRIHD
jgi:inhibitor of cysteine peptidase